ncbi:hypothetical protein BS50DRAFT_202546 [Corynespora cassiicola Philippines]|uniref:Uncharacterized protein n=1 Tax=Corynespora cassiicola Philippines TaxID=1448308 RepID=A0A2T2N507_CORCC|nr:hypothetical protein BS50DRAFT_202546 [Corynespora cassiicola Philippines]
MGGRGGFCGRLVQADGFGECGERVRVCACRRGWTGPSRRVGVVRRAVQRAVGWQAAGVTKGNGGRVAEGSRRGGGWWAVAGRGGKKNNTGDRKREGKSSKKRAQARREEWQSGREGVGEVAVGGGRVK